MGSTNGDASVELLHSQAHVWNHTFNYVTSMSLRCAVQLGIPDIISNHNKPVTLSELVEALSIPLLKSSHVYRLMRILVHSGFFSIEKIEKDEREVEGYVLTPSTKLLLKNDVTNISPFVLMETDPVLVTPFYYLSAFLQGNLSTPFEAAHGTNFWDYCAQHPEFNNLFNNAMACHAKLVMDLVVKNSKTIFEGSRSLVDVGGGTGASAMALSKAFPNLMCTVLDLPQVVSGMEQPSKNIKFVAGDMFKSIPSADIILLKWILHDWSDEDCVKILKRCKESILSKEEGGKLVVIDAVIECDKGKSEFTESQLCLDITMMVAVTGKERTEAQWEKLYQDAGFKSYKMTHALGLNSIIEVFP